MRVSIYVPYVQNQIEDSISMKKLKIMEKEVRLATEGSSVIDV